MSGDRIAAVVGIAAMLFLVVSRLGNDATPRNRMWRMAGAWALIFIVVTVLIAAFAGK